MSGKLKLALEELSVESFDVTDLEEGRRGTVLGNSATDPGSDSWGDDTCGATCALDCNISANWNCYTDPFGGCASFGGGTSGPSQNNNGFTC
jgi:hypothetical protein